MIILQRNLGDIVILDLSGKITLGSGASEELANLMDGLLKKGIKAVVLNLEKIDYIDSTGIGELVGYLSKFDDASKKIVLLKPKERILKLLKITQLDKVFKIFYEEGEAISFCERGESNPQGI